MFTTTDINLASAMTARGFRFQGCEHAPAGTLFRFDDSILVRGKTVTAESFQSEFENRLIKADAWTLLEARRELEEKVKAERMANGLD